MKRSALIVLLFLGLVGGTAMADEEYICPNSGFSGDRFVKRCYYSCPGGQYEAVVQMGDCPAKIKIVCTYSLDDMGCKVYY
jgi:hypothetical protein